MPKDLRNIDARSSYTTIVRHIICLKLLDWAISICPKIDRATLCDALLPWMDELRINCRDEETLHGKS